MNPTGRYLVLGLAGVLLTGCPKPNLEPQGTAEIAPTPSPTIPAENDPTPSSTPVVVNLPTPEPTAWPEQFIPRRSYDTARLFNGLKVYSHLQTTPGGIAPLERKVEDSFSVDISLKVKVPVAMTTLEHFQKANPELTQALPMLGDLLSHGKVSPYYHALYSTKVRSLQQDLHTLEEILSRHNFFDCGTILELTNPSTGRKALWLQADMDVVTDGSDADRFLEVDGSSVHYQPFTSYRWPKLTTTPSQFLVEKQARIAAAQAELATAVTAERGQTLRRSVAALQAEIGDLTTFSYLISKADPFIVLPGYMLRDRALPFCPRLGDYVAVIYKNKIYPAIFGDVGPAVKVGEASLRLATALNGKASANNRATSELDVSYLVFPRSADEPAGPPDYEKWRARCVELLADLGASNVNVEHWDNILPPLPTPTPVPVETALPTPVPLASPTP